MTNVKTFAVLFAIVGLVCFITYFGDYSFLISNQYITTKYKKSTISYVLDTQGCKVPKLDSFDSTVKKFYSRTTGDVWCKGKLFLKVANNNVVLLEDNVKKYYPTKNLTCTYNPILRNPYNYSSSLDDRYGYGETKELTFDQQPEDEFLKVTCKINHLKVYEDYLATTPLKNEVETRCDAISTSKAKLNVIIVGIDSISKLNFQRHFKLTAEYLKKLSAFEFHGYIKVGDNTFPNLTPLLTGQFVEYYYKKENDPMYFDDLDFIWKNYSDMGYRTFLAEDAPRIATYNYLKNGFKYPPTDYYFRPFAIAVEASKWLSSSKRFCFQAKPEIRVLFEYLVSFVKTMGDRPYFAFEWVARLTHDEINRAGYADKPSYDLLKTLNDSGVLNKSLVIFLSDHGIRFGGIRKTYIGFIEERMPFMFMLLPSWFLRRHPEIAKNLEENQRKFTTPFDIHETLVDFLGLNVNTPGLNTNKGLSLFRPIPTTRTCKDALVLPQWCTCHQHYKISIDDQKTRQASKAVLESINKLTQPHIDVCAKLNLNQILSAMVIIPDRLIPNSTNSDNVEQHHFLISIRTTPGDAEFESMILFDRKFLKVLETSRINMYGHQGDCVSDAKLRKYCFCKN